MRLGVVYPQTDLHGDAGAVVPFGRGVEALDYDGIVVYDHVVGAEHANREPPLWGPYTEKDPFHDPFFVLALLATSTERLELATGILILPQRQTVLVARQAADVALLSGGRLRLGVGTGWNWVEYDALGEDFSTRGRRLDEQLDVLQRLWRDPLVTVHGAFHDFERVALNPRPARPIPLWVGGFSRPAFRRAARFGDGFTFAGMLDFALGSLERLLPHLESAGRSTEGYGLELIVDLAEPTQVAEAAATWQNAGGTHVAVATMGKGLDSVEAQLDHLAAVRDALKAELG